MKKVLSILLVLVMALGILPTSILATDNNSITVGFAVVDCVNGNVEVMHKELTVEPGLASKYLGGQYGDSIGITVEIGENDVTPIDVLVAAHLDEYGENFTDSTAGNYITGFDYISKMFGIESEVTYTANGIMPYMPFDDANNTAGYDIGYAVNQYIVKPNDEICFYRIDYNAYPPSVYASFDKTEYEVSVGEEVTLELGFCATMSYSDEPFPAINAEIFMLNDDGGVGSKIKNTDENGNVTVSFENPGIYYLTCKGEVSYYDAMWGMDNTGALSPAYTKITVNEIPPVQTGEFDVKVHVGPANANVEFYECSGFDLSGYDVLGEKISATDNGINQDTSYHTYTMKLDKGTYSFRATDENGKSLGGMTFDISAETTEIYLRQADIYTTTKINSVYADKTQYRTEVIDADGNLATAGEAYLDSSSRTRYPYLLCAYGNAKLYTVKLIPSDEVSKLYDLGINTIMNYTVSKGTTVTTKTGTLPTLIDAVILAPMGSKVQVFNQIKNFYTEEISYTDKEETDDVISYTYRLPKNNGNHTYRVSLNGKITKAGYLKLSSEAEAKTDITFSENENPKIRPEYDTSTTIGSRMEDNIMLNINKQNYLKLEVGENFKVRAYRAWQIINSDTGNIMIEPDFEYKIISGDSVTVTQQGQNAIVSAKKEGVSVIEVTYDAIEIGGNTNYKGIYGAIDPMRKGLFVVNVGKNAEAEIIMPEWDSDFDTVYFTGNSGTYNFAPKSESDIMVKCNDNEIKANNDGTYTLPINEGNNIVSVASENTLEYVIIKGNRIEVNIENVTSPNESIKQGDTVNISFNGLHMPIPKFSGIYNPGYGSTVKTTYLKNGGSQIASKGTQYNFINNNTISLTVYDKGEVHLTDGKISLTSMGFQPGAHREITDSGIGANFSASAISAEFCNLPDISFNVEKNDDLSYMETAKETYSNLSNVNILCGKSSFEKSFSISSNTESKASIKNTTATFSSINSAYPFTVSATAVNDKVTMEFRYWELGDKEKNIVKINSGETVSLENNFSGEKTIYMEIAVKPENPVFGEEKVYSYVVYKTTSGFLKPVLKTINIKDSESNDFSEPFGVLYSDNNSGVAYTENDYYCYVPKNAESVIMSVARLNGTSDITVFDETKNIGTTETAFSPIALTGGETIVTLSLADGGEYNIKLIKTDKIMNKKVAYDSEKIAVSFINTEDTELNFYIVSYDNEKRMTDASMLNKKLVAGENTVYLDLSEFEGENNLSLFVWDENYSPIFNVTDIEKEN